MRTIVEVDQSNKIEQPRKTTIAFSDGVSFAVILPHPVKNEALRYLRNQGKSKDTAQVLIFAAGVFLLLRDYLDRVHRVKIDVEYPGWEGTIKAFLLQHIWRNKPDFEEWRIVFTPVGKGSPAHRKANAVREGKDTVSRTVRVGELIEVLESK
jgi:hypothetical protein